MAQKDQCTDIPDIPPPADNKYEEAVQTFHNLMPFKVREILLVSSLYDAFIVEEEGLISELDPWRADDTRRRSFPRGAYAISPSPTFSSRQHGRSTVLVCV